MAHFYATKLAPELKEIWPKYQKRPNQRFDQYHIVQLETIIGVVSQTNHPDRKNHHTRPTIHPSAAAAAAAAKEKKERRTTEQWSRETY